MRFLLAGCFTFCFSFPEHDCLSFLFLSLFVNLQYGWTALYGACYRKDAKIVEMLMEAGVDLEVKTKVRRGLANFFPGFEIDSGKDRHLGAV